MKIRESRHGDVVLLEPRGSLLGGPDAERFHALIQAFVDNGTNKVVVSLADVRRINSPGIGILIRANDDLKAKGGVLRIAEATRRIQQVFYLIHLPRHIDVHETVDDALAAFGTRAAAATA